MPFTSYHIGVALLVGYFLYRRVNLATLVLSSVLVDIEPLIVSIISRGYRLHGYTHTILSSIIFGMLIGYILYLLRRYLHTTLTTLSLTENSGSLRTYILGGVVGWLLHVLMDSPIYYDIRPFEPISVNPLFVPQYIEVVMAVYELAFYVGSIFYLHLLYRHLATVTTRNAGMVLIGFVGIGLGFISIPIGMLIPGFWSLVLILIALYLIYMGLVRLVSRYSMRLRLVFITSLISLALCYVLFEYMLGNIDFRILSQIGLGIYEVHAMVIASCIALLATVVLFHPILCCIARISKDRSLQLLLIAFIVGLVTIPLFVGIPITILTYLGLILKSPKLLEALSTIEREVLSTHADLC
ncbi:MAG: hypothetical protein QXH34_02120 [Ignisphaera sp.]